MLGLPRGGVVVAVEVADALGAELDVLVVRKAGVPWHPELAIGAVTAGGDRVYNADVIANAGLSDSDVDAAFGTAMAEAVDRERRLRGSLPPPLVAGRQVVIVDDGIATGATIRAAAQVLRAADPRPARTIIAVPVAPPDTVIAVAAEVDALVVLRQPARFAAVGEWYERFGQVEDDDVRALLAAGSGDPPGP